MKMSNQSRVRKQSTSSSIVTTLDVSCTFTLCRTGRRERNHRAGVLAGRQRGSRKQRGRRARRGVGRRLCSSSTERSVTHRSSNNSHRRSNNSHHRSRNSHRRRRKSTWRSTMSLGLRRTEEGRELASMWLRSRTVLITRSMDWIG